MDGDLCNINKICIYIFAGASNLSIFLTFCEKNGMKNFIVLLYNKL